MAVKTKNYIKRRVEKETVVPEPKLKRKMLTEDGVTLMQEEYLHKLIAGQTMVDAYSEVFDVSNMPRSRVYTQASRLLDLPAVGRRLQVLIADKQKKMLAADSKWIRQHVTDRLMAESIDRNSPAQARIKALELLGKVDLVGMFTEKVQTEITHKRSSVEVEKEIKEKLESYLNGLRLIDGTKATD